MPIKKPNIVPIPSKMEKFYGTGFMLHPTKESIIELLDQIPLGKITTIDLLSKKLANIYGTDVSCPMRLGNAIKQIAKDYPVPCIEVPPYWRVIKKDGCLVKTQNRIHCATQLGEEGITLRYISSDKIEVVLKDTQFFDLMN